MFIPIDKMKQLREAAKNGDVRAKKILTMQMNGEDFGSSLDEYFAPQPTQEEKPILHGEVHSSKQMGISNSNSGEEISDPKLLKFLEYNGVKVGDPDYESTIEAYYQEFPKARPQKNIEPNLPVENDEYSIYGDDDEPIQEDEEVTAKVVEEHDILDKLIEDEIEAIDAYSKAITKIMDCQEMSDSQKRKIISRLKEIRDDEEEHFKELKVLKKISENSEFVEANEMM